MQNILKNWKTSLAGVVIIGIAALHTFAGVNIPGAMDISQALTVGIGLIVASDSATPPTA